MNSPIVSRVLLRVGAAVVPSIRLRRALHQAETGQIVQAFPTLARGARRGNAAAQYRVGRAYLEGAGVPASRADAAHWLERAAEAGVTEAQHLLATYYAGGMAAGDAASGHAGLFGHAAPTGEPSYVRALHWSRRAAEGGSPEAKALLAHMLLSGPDRARHVEEAGMLFAEAAGAGSAQGALGHGLALLRSSQDGSVDGSVRQAAVQIACAAEAGLPLGCYMLGVLHEKGAGMPQNPAAAAALYARAAEHGLRAAQTRWGRALLDGYGVAPNPVTGESWLRRAALAGDADAAVMVGVLYARHDGLPPNFTEAAAWFGRAAGQGDAAGSYLLGRLHLDGSGVMRDHTEAARLFAQAAGQGHVDAMFAIGSLLGGGHGVPQDRAAAQRWFRGAAEAGHGAAALMLGRYLRRGTAGPADIAGARAWLEQARQSNMAEADAELAQLR